MGTNGPAAIVACWEQLHEAVLELATRCATPRQRLLAIAERQLLVVVDLGSRPGVVVREPGVVHDRGDGRVRRDVAAAPVPAHALEHGGVAVTRVVGVDEAVPALRGIRIEREPPVRA